MMKKSYFYLLFVLTVLLSCSSSKSVIKTVNQKYTNLVFSPDNGKQSFNSVLITVSPVDAKSLNNETYDAAFRNGSYERESFELSEALKTKNVALTKAEKNAYKAKQNALLYLDKLVQDNLIPKPIAMVLKTKIIYENAYAYDGTEVDVLSGITDGYSQYNPFKIDRNYLSIFKVNFDNKGADVERLKLKEFQLTSNEERLSPLPSNYFENNLKDRSESVKNAYRMGMPEELIITPNQKIVKYLAVPAINEDNNQLQVQFIRDKQILNFDFTVSKKEIQKTYTLEKYDFGVYSGSYGASNTYMAIYFSDKDFYALRKHTLYVSNEKKYAPASIYAINIDLSSTDIYYASEKGFVFSSIKNNKKLLKYTKAVKDKKTGSY